MRVKAVGVVIAVKGQILVISEGEQRVQTRVWQPFDLDWRCLEHPVAIEVDDLEAALKHIESKGGTVIRSDGTASIAWVHPLSTKMVFIELSQAGFEGVPGTRIPS